MGLFVQGDGGGVLVGAREFVSGTAADRTPGDFLHDLSDALYNEVRACLLACLRVQKKTLGNGGKTGRSVCVSLFCLVCCRCRFWRGRLRARLRVEFTV